MSAQNLFRFTSVVVFGISLTAIGSSPSLAQSGSRLCGYYTTSGTHADGTKVDYPRIAVLYEARKAESSYTARCDDALSQIRKIRPSHIYVDGKKVLLNWQRARKSTCESVGQKFEGQGFPRDICDKMSANDGYMIIKRSAAAMATIKKENIKTGIDKVSAGLQLAFDTVIDAAKDFKFSAAEPVASYKTCPVTTSKTRVGYCEEMALNMAFCAKMFGQSTCIGPGKMGQRFFGSTGISTYTDKRNGSIGATLDASTKVTYTMFGKPVTFGLSCTMTKGAKTSWSHTFGASFKTPEVQPISTSSILADVIKTKSAAADQMSKLLENSGCRIDAPSKTLFSLPAINIADMGMTVSVNVTDWKISDRGASALFSISVGAKATVGGSKVEMFGQTIKMPGYTWKPFDKVLLSKKIGA